MLLWKLSCNMTSYSIIVSAYLVNISLVDRTICYYCIDIWYRTPSHQHIYWHTIKTMNSKIAKYLFALNWIWYFLQFLWSSGHIVRFSQTVFAIPKPPKIGFWWCKNNFYYQIIIKLSPVPVWAELGPVQPQLVYIEIIYSVSS